MSCHGPRRRHPGNYKIRALNWIVKELSKIRLSLHNSLCLLKCSERRPAVKVVGEAEYGRLVVSVEESDSEHCRSSNTTSSSAYSMLGVH